MNTPEGYTGWFEPESAANTDYQPIYPYNHITQTESGHSFEMDDTPGRERVRLQHRSGTFIEMHPNGDQVHKVYGNDYEITIQDKNILVEGKCNITVNGDCNINVKGDKIEVIEGNYEQHVLGNFSQTIEQTALVSCAGDMTITAGAGVMGSLTINTGDHVYVGSDLTVDGDLVATKIASHTRVDAGTGVSAGAEGFVTGTGGISVGVPTVAAPVATPGVIMAPDIFVIPGTGFGGTGSLYAFNVFATNIECVDINGAIANFGSVSSPYANLGIMSAVLMTDATNTGIYNSHVHFVGGKGGGVTSSPVGPMI